MDAKLHPDGYRDSYSMVMPQKKPENDKEHARVSFNSQRIALQYGNPALLQGIRRKESSIV